MKHSHIGLLLLLAIFLVSQAAIDPVPAQTQTTLSLDPPQYSATKVDETFTVNIQISDVQNLWGWVASVTWNPEYVNPMGDPSEGNFMKSAGSTLFLSAPARSGYFPEISSFLMVDRGVSGNGTLATLTFKVSRQCVQSPITLLNTTLYSSDIDPKTGNNYEISHIISPSTTSVSLIAGNAPIANAGEDQTVAEDTEVVLNGSRTYPTNEGLTYTWSFFDGSNKTLNGTIVHYTFNTPGVYNVTLTVENANGEKSEAKVTITVRDTTPPVPVILVNNREPGQVVPVGQRIEFSGCKSYDPEGGTIREYRWKFGDEPSLDVNATHIFATAGTYDVSLTIYDLRGNNSATKNIKVTAGTSGSQNPNGSGGSGFNLTQTPLAIVILITLTVVTLTGSAFWLRKRTHENGSPTFNSHSASFMIQQLGSTTRVKPKKPHDISTTRSTKSHGKKSSSGRAPNN